MRGPKPVKSASRCPYSGRCGGCTLIDVPYAEQAESKQRRVEELIGSFGPVEPVIRMKNPDRYRNKVTSVFGYDYRRRRVCGVYRAYSHEIIPVTDCLLENRRAEAVIRTIEELAPSFKITNYNEDEGTGILRYVQVRTARATGEVMLTIVTSGPIIPSRENFLRVLRQKHPEITTIVQNINDRTDSLVLAGREKVLFGPGYIIDEINGKKFRISSRAFYQVNPIQTAKLYNIAVDMAGLSGRERVIDAYCGIGTIGILASDKAAEVLGIELSPEAVRDAEENARLNNAGNVHFIEGDATELLAGMAEDYREAEEDEEVRMMQGKEGKSAEKPDVVFLDPPRAGATEEFLDALVCLQPAKVVYISCNPETLARDLDYLLKRGYEFRKAVPVDMFPYTRHIETIVLLQKLNS